VQLHSERPPGFPPLLGTAAMRPSRSPAHPLPPPLRVDRVARRLAAVAAQQHEALGIVDSAPALRHGVGAPQRGLEPGRHARGPPSPAVFHVVPPVPVLVARPAGRFPNVETQLSWCRLQDRTDPLRPLREATQLPLPTMFSLLLLFTLAIHLA